VSLTVGDDSPAKRRGRKRTNVSKANAEATSLVRMLCVSAGRTQVVSQNAILGGVSGVFALPTTHGKDSIKSNPCGVRERIRGVTRLAARGVNPRASKSTTQTFSGVNQFYEGNRGKPRLKLRLPRWGIRSWPHEPAYAALHRAILWAQAPFKAKFPPFAAISRR